MESYDLIKRERYTEIVRNSHRQSGAIHHSMTLGFRQHLKDAIEVVREMFSEQTDDEILLFDGAGEVIDEFRISEVMCDGTRTGNETSRFFTRNDTQYNRAN